MISIDFNVFCFLSSIFPSSEAILRQLMKFDLILAERMEFIWQINLSKAVLSA